MGVVATLCACTQAPAKKAETEAAPTVFAAASLTDALEAVAADFERKSGQSVRLAFAASGAVARQVEAGAPADLIILADTPWMDRLAQSGRIRADTRTILLRNRLVLIGGPKAQPMSDPIEGLTRMQGRIAVGDPQSVPAGAYAQAWLEDVGLWSRLQPRFVMGADVRAVRAFVARGEAPFGLVYRSDAVASDEVRILFEPPASQQPDIVYPAALSAGASAKAQDFLTYLSTPDAAAVFERFGFDPSSRGAPSV
ncbi:hypothetical protein LTR94_026452 [Friedmanniomyces endolithicus]|nr:hypothetical protein LTR94_026452 [Friedmanniomyces endolithicus]